EGIPVDRIGGGELVDGEVALEHAALGPERLYAGFDVGSPSICQVHGRWRTFAVMEPETVDAHAHAAELHMDIGTARKLDDIALPAGKDLIALVGVPAKTQWATDMVEHDRLCGKGARERGEIRDLGMVEPGIKGEA